MSTIKKISLSVIVISILSIAAMAIMTNDLNSDGEINSHPQRETVLWQQERNLIISEPVEVTPAIDSGKPAKAQVQAPVIETPEAARVQAVQEENTPAPARIIEPVDESVLPYDAPNSGSDDQILINHPEDCIECGFGFEVINTPQNDKNQDLNSYKL